MTRPAVRLLVAGSGVIGLSGLLSVVAPVTAVLAPLRDLPVTARDAGPDAVALAVAGTGCWVGLAWLALALAVLTVGARDGRCGRVARRVAAVTVPPTARRLLAVGVGLAVVTSAAPGPAQASGPGSGPPAAPVTRAHGFDLDWPVLRARPITRKVQRAPVVVVRRGDNLWAVARRHLPAGATASAVAAAWPRWYSANRSVIGPDPDLLLPGQRLVPPTSSPGGSS
jgi:hypothetical protein